MHRQISFRLTAQDIHHVHISEPDARHQDHTSRQLVVRILALDILEWTSGVSWSYSPHSCHLP